MKNFNELDAKICSCTADLNAKLDGSNGKRAILLCGGTGCLSSNSMDIKASFEELVAKNHMEDKVTVNIVGCFGFCSQGSFVKIYPEDTLYRLVKPEDVEEIFEKDIIGGEVVERLLYIEPLTGEKVAKQEDINFYKKQRRIALHGAGAFVCGEETALLNSIEGKRGMPRPRPPFPAVKGLWGKPTIVNNVETLACVPFILREGAGEFSNCGTEKSKGTKVFALGGKVNNVGLVEIPMGTALLNYSGFQDAGVNVLAGFDLNTKKPAAKTEKKIYSMDLLDTFCEENDVRIGIISTPASEAQMVCEKFINNDIDIIWNFAPVNLLAPEGITVKNENLTASLMTLRMHMKENY